MLRLPVNLPQDLASSLEEALQKGTAFEDRLESLLRVFFERIQVEDAVAAFSCPAAMDSAMKSCSCALSSRSSASAEFSADLVSKWLKSGIHDAVFKDLTQRLTAVSFSAYGWPYPSALDSAEDEAAQCSLPRDYTLLIPFSSDLIVYAKSSKPFFGYFAFMSDSFMELTETRVNLVVTLPQLLSELMAVVVNASDADTEQLSFYAHGVKQYLFLNQELTRRLAEAVEQGDIAETTQILSSMNATRDQLMLQTSSVLLLNKHDAGRLRLNPVPVQINELVEEVTQEFKPLFEKSGIALEQNLDPVAGFVNVDPAVFPAAVRNLLDNALKYSNSGGSVYVRTASSSNNGALRIEFEDDGIGIPIEEREKVFEKHYRCGNCGAQSGSGLGLALVEHIISMHQGRVYISDSAKNKTLFVVELPEYINLC